MQYMCLIYNAEDNGPQPGTDEFGPYMQSYVDFTQEVEDAGVMSGGNALNLYPRRPQSPCVTAKPKLSMARLPKPKNSWAVITFLTARIWTKR